LRICRDNGNNKNSSSSSSSSGGIITQYVSVILSPRQPQMMRQQPTRLAQGCAYYSPFHSASMKACGHNNNNNRNSNTIFACVSSPLRPPYRRYRGYPEPCPTFLVQLHTRRCESERMSVAVSHTAVASRRLFAANTLGLLRGIPTRASGTRTYLAPTKT
ncbi:unnamed protein product, partial [Ectocarpus sp. 4 AP-2014]